jgi:hypothetical protein
VTDWGTVEVTAIFGERRGMRTCVHCRRGEHPTVGEVALREIRKGVFVALHKGCWWDIEHDNAVDRELELAGIEHPGHGGEES